MHQTFFFQNICFIFTASASNSCPSASSRLTAESTKSSQTSSQPPPSSSQITTFHESKLDQSPAEHCSSSSLTHSQVDASPLTGSPYPVPGDPPESTDLTSVSQVDQTISADEGPESAMFAEQPPVSLLPLETVSPPEPPQSPSSKAESRRQSYQSVWARKSVLLLNGSLLLGSTLSSHNPVSTLEAASPAVKSLSSISLFNEFPPDEWSPPMEEQGPGHPLGLTPNPQAERMDEEDRLESGE